MPKPPPVVEVGSPRPRNAILIHDDDDRSDGRDRHRESRPVVGMGGHDWRRASGDHFGGSGRGREGSSAGGHAAVRSPPPRRNPLAPSSPAVVRAPAQHEVIELDDDDDFRSERPEKVASRVKEEPLEYLGSDSEDSRRARVASSAPGGSRKSRKRRRESPVSRVKPHREDGRGEAGSSGKQKNRKGKNAGSRRHVHKGGGRGRHDAAPSSRVGAVVASRARSRNGDQTKVVSAANCRASVFSEDCHHSSGSPANLKSTERRRHGPKGAGSGRHDAAPARPVGTVVASRTRTRNRDQIKVASAAKYPARLDEIEEVSSDDNRESRDNKEEEDVVKGKNKVDDDGDSEDMYKSPDEEESGEDGNGIHDHSYAGVDEEDADDTTEPEEEKDGGEEEEEEKSQEAEEELRGTPSSNAKTGGSARSGGDGTPPIRTKYFEGLRLVDKADTTSAGEGLRKRTRSQRRCSDEKLRTRGTLSKPYCIEVSDSEPEEEVPPPGQTEQALPSSSAFEDDSGGDDRAPAKKRRRRQLIVDSDDSDTDTDDSESEEDRTFTVNARKGQSSSRPKNGSAPYRQQQTAKEGRKDYAGCCNPRRVNNYAGNPADWGNLQMQGDISFKKNALLPHRGKRGKLTADKNAYDDLFDSILDDIEKHPNGYAPAHAQAQAQQHTQPLLFSFEEEDEVEEEKSEHEKFMDKMWGEMDFAMQIKNEIPEEEGEESNGQEIPLCIEGKEHDFVEDDQIGIVCRHCDLVHTEIRDVVAPMGNWAAERDARADRELDRELDRSIKNILISIGYEGECSIGSHRSGPVWYLVPGVREDMFAHQREAFEFMWNKLAGGIDIEQVKNSVKTDALSGCVISHAPGTGKTRLAITFLQSYLELFPQCSPMIIAPKVMLATWEQEFKKWNVKVPFHVISSPDLHWNGDKTMERKAENDEEFAQKLLMNSFKSKYRRLLKFQSWVEGSSVIGLSYSLFTRLAKGEGKDGDMMRRLLLQRPGLLILDEGHTARNDDSDIWKLLVQVRTEKRIILSGTPFQNNFEELYNILCLLHADSKLPGNDEDKGYWTSLTLDNVTDEKINEIRTKLNRFVHIYNGDILQKSLPGLRESVVILNPLPRQKEILEMMEKSETKGNFDLEYKVSLASIHPSLVTCMGKLSDEVTSILDKPSLERLRVDPFEGVKARFVYEIVDRCCSKERVLVFSQYHEPLDLIMEQLNKKFNWTKDKEILLMSGKVSAETRQSLMVTFNNMKSDAKVMLATTKACGEGIQLIGASRVVLLDVVWNPSVGRQAIGRAYRIGQEKIVYTYNLIAEGTQEKSKYDRQAQKDHMSKKLFSNMSQPAQCNQSPGSILALKRKSPESIFNDSILEDMTEDENLKEMFMNILPSQ